jgi:Effector-associated domain 1/CHAT domain
MTKEKALIALREALEELYEDVDEAKRIVRAAGLKSASIRWGGSARTNWFYIIGEAEKHNRLDTLFQVVQADDGANNVKFQQAYQAYLAAIGQTKGEPGGSTHSPALVAPARPVKILFLSANPAGTEPLKLDEEARAIKEALRKSRFYERFALESELAVRYTDLQALLLEYQPDIVHFSSHGSTAGELMLTNALGASHPVSPQSLTQLFTLLKDNIRCVVLNACYSELQGGAIAEQIEAVVGMKHKFSDDAAIKFAVGFYTALGFGRDVQTAFALGCNSINLAGLDEQDKPQLLPSNGKQAAIVFAQ